MDTESSFFNSMRSTLAYTASPKFQQSLEHIYLARLGDAIEHLTLYTSSNQASTCDFRTWISNCMLDISADINFSGHTGAFRSFPLMHPAVNSLKTMVSYIGVYMQLRRLPRYVTWMVESVSGIIAPNFSQNLSLIGKGIDERLKKSVGDEDISKSFCRV
jgi:hypothetical protein